MSNYSKIIGELASKTGCSKTELYDAWYESDLEILLKSVPDEKDLRALTQDKAARLAWRKKHRGFEVHPGAVRTSDATKTANSESEQCSGGPAEESGETPEAAQASERGYVYILVNPAFTNYVKIGKTINDPHERAKQVSKGTGVPAPYAVIWDILVRDCHEAEREVHRRLAKFRARNDREFFALPPKEAIAEVASICAPFAIVEAKGESS